MKNYKYLDQDYAIAFSARDDDLAWEIVESMSRDGYPDAGTVEVGLETPDGEREFRVLDLGDEE